MVLHLVVPAGAEHRAPLRAALHHLGRAIPILCHHSGADLRHRPRQIRPKGILDLLPRLAQPQLGLVVRETIRHQRQRTVRGGDAGRQLASRVVGDHPLNVIGGKGHQLGHADAAVIEGIAEETRQRDHGCVWLGVWTVIANATIPM